MDATTPAPIITEQTCEAFARAADALQLRRANRIAESDIDDFVGLCWMDWRGGALRITPLGQMALSRIRLRLNAAVA